MEEARQYFDNGLTESGRTHWAVYAIQHLLWFGDRSRGIPRLPGSHNNEKRKLFVREWLEKNHTGHTLGSAGRTVERLFRVGEALPGRLNHGQESSY